MITYPYGLSHITSVSISSKDIKVQASQEDTKKSGTPKGAKRLNFSGTLT